MKVGIDKGQNMPSDVQSECDYSFRELSAVLWQPIPRYFLERRSGLGYPTGCI